MKVAVGTVLLVGVALTGGLLLFAQTTSNLEGVWQIQQVTPRNGEPVNRTPLPSLVIFTTEHYSWIRIAGTQAPRNFGKHWLPTDAEKLARYDAMFVNAGTYEINEGALTMRPVVARVPEFVGGNIEYRYRLAGDTLTLTGLDEHSFDGVQAPWAKIGQAATLTLVRITP